METHYITTDLSPADRVQILTARKDLIWNVVKVFVVGLSFVLVLPFLPGRSRLPSMPGTRAFAIIYSVGGSVVLLLTLSMIRGCRKDVSSLNHDLRQGQKISVAVTVTDAMAKTGLIPPGFDAVGLKTTDLEKLQMIMSGAKRDRELILEYGPNSKLLLSLSEIST